MTSPNDKPEHEAPADKTGHEAPAGPAPKVIKIFPRNLTARADYLVPGNPVTSRPESGVDNCFPGLEYDQRNLDQRFFPGLSFEFQREDGAVLVDFKLTDAQQVSGLTRDDMPAARPLFLWALYGKFSTADAEPTLFAFHQTRGPEALRRVHDLLPGRVAIAFGPRPDFLSSGSPLFAAELIEKLHAAYEAEQPLDKFVVVRERAGLLKYAVFSDERTKYLDDDGVIDVDTFAPGELTKTLCAPWVYDFRDCVCFYWAANKPDMAEGDGRPNVNFLRERFDLGTGEAKPPPAPTPIYLEWREQLMKHGTMISGAWRDLPVVLDDREVPTDASEPPPTPPAAVAFDRLEHLFNREEAISELKYLATVEHALIVEYLYAHYSLNAPRELPASQKGKGAARQHKIFTAAGEVLRVATDEMRHFLWVNRLLRLLECDSPVTSRAKVVGLSPDRDKEKYEEKGEERPRKVIPDFKYLNRDFGLRRLTREVLQDFIRIEANSRNTGPGGVSFGMYVHLLASFMRRPLVPGRQDEAVDLIKLLVDEGDEHGKTFLRISEALGDMKEAEYLRQFRDPADRELTQEIKTLLDLGDVHYQSFLSMIHVSYALGPRAGGELISKAVLLMQELHKTGHELAAQNVPLRFTEPDQGAIRATLEAEGELAALEEIQRKTLESLRAVEGAAGPKVGRMARQQAVVTQAIYEDLKGIASRPESKGRERR